MIIPLDNGSANAHQTFNVQLGENSIDFEVNYIQTGQWAVNLSLDGVLLAAGVMLEPNCDVIANYNLDLGGSLIFIGEQTTLDNLGESNSLHWVEDE